MILLGDRGFLGRHLKAVLPLCGDDGTVVNAAGVVKGIAGNMAKPFEMIGGNLKAALDAFALAGDGRIVNFGSTCAYSPECRVPFRPCDYLVGEPEETNRAYAVAKRTIYEMQKAHRRQFGSDDLYIVMPNLYGPGDQFGEDSHVIPSMVRKVWEAKQSHKAAVTFFGTGVAEREFLFVEDAARSIAEMVAEVKSEDPVHLTSGEGTITIRDLAHLIAEEMGYEGRIEWDATKPDGQLKRKLQDQFLVDNPISFREGIRRTIAYFLNGVIDKTAVRV